MISNRTRRAYCCSLAFLSWQSRRYYCASSAFLLPAARHYHNHHPQHHPANPISHGLLLERAALPATTSIIGPTFSFSFSSSTTSTSTTELDMGSNSNTQEEEAMVADIAANLDFVRNRVKECCQEVGRDPNQVRLVAVSKTKPLELLQKAYEHGQREFGENYVQELVEKAKAFGDDQQKKDVKWHFIGALQSNKANLLVKSVVPFGKLTVETVSSLKLAKKLNTAMKDVLTSDADDGDRSKMLDIYVQVNTSGEESKSGISPKETPELCQQIVAECDQLQLKGIMTIGAPGDMTCLESLATCRIDVAKALRMDVNDLELSMGMSGDFEVAIQKGSTNVRVGSTIFGVRDYSNN